MPVIGEKMMLLPEDGNEHDQHAAVAVMKGGGMLGISLYIIIGLFLLSECFGLKEMSTVVKVLN